MFPYFRPKFFISFILIALVSGLPSVSQAQAPIGLGVDFSGTPTSGIAPLTVQFNDESTGDPTGWAWYFGDEDFSANWSEATGSAEWSARFGASSVVLQDGSIVLMGGSLSSFNTINDVWRSTDGGESWTQVTAHAEWSARTWHSSVVLPDGSILLIGGLDYSVGFKNDVWRSIDGGATWSLVTNSAAWAPRYGHQSLVLPDGSIVLMGGFLGGSCSNDVWRSTDNGETWAEVTAHAGWQARTYFSSVVLPDGDIVVMGGQTDSDYENDVWRSSDQGETWTQLIDEAAWSPRGYPTSVVMPDASIVLVGGMGENAAVWRSTDNGATWTQLAGSVGWTFRYDHTCVGLPDGKIVLMGGIGYYDIENDVWQLETAGSNLQNPEHTYASQGTYDVVLSVSGPDSADTETKSDYINVLYDVILPLFFR